MNKNQIADTTFVHIIGMSLGAESTKIEESKWIIKYGGKDFYISFEHFEDESLMVVRGSDRRMKLFNNNASVIDVRNFIMG